MMKQQKKPIQHSIYFQNFVKKYKASCYSCHPKTKHIKKPKYFMGENVHGKSLELIYNSELVVTRNSSAITYAIEYLSLFYLFM